MSGGVSCGTRGYFRNHLERPSLSVSLGEIKPGSVTRVLLMCECESGRGAQSPTSLHASDENHDVNTSHLVNIQFKR